jgi:hypothetical protein
VEEFVIPRNATMADVLGSHGAQGSKHFEPRRDLAKSPRLREIFVSGEIKKKGKGSAHRSAVAFPCARSDTFCLVARVNGQVNACV